MSDVPTEPNEVPDTGQRGGNAVAERPPSPPAFRRGDERREATADQELCEFCQRHPRKPASRGGGPRPKHCEHVWGRDHRGKDVTCARLDDAHDLWLAVYGSTGPLSHLDFGAQVRHLSDLRTALTALFTVLDPVRDDLTLLDERLAGEVAQALARAEEANTEAELARREAEAAATARDQALAAEQRAVEEAAEARRNEGVAIVEQDEARAAKRLAEDREEEADKRASAAQQVAKRATEALAAANTTIADQAAKIGELTGANSQLTTRVQQLAEETAELRSQIDQQRIEFETALTGARTEAAGKLDDQRAECETKLRKQQAAFEQQRKNTERETADQLAELNGKVADLTGQVAQLSTSAAQATADAERNQGAVNDLNRLRTRLLTTLAAAEPDEDGSALRIRLMHLVDEADMP